MSNYPIYEFIGPNSADIDEEMLCKCSDSYPHAINLRPMVGEPIWSQQCICITRYWLNSIIQLESHARPESSNNETGFITSYLGSQEVNQPIE